MKPLSILAVAFSILSQPVFGAEYYNRKWFDWPDPTQAHFSNGCAHYVEMDLKCRRHGWKVYCSRAKICTNPTHVKVEVLRHDVRFIVSGPNSPNDAVRRAVEDIAAGCASIAIEKGVEAAAATPSPEPVARVGAAAGVTLATFKTCILGVSTAAVAAKIVNQLSIKIDVSKSHWSPV